MERNIISIKKRNSVPGGVFGDLERKLCDITIQDGKEKLYKTCYLDEDKILKYINEYENYLNGRKNKFVEKNKEKTLEKRIKNNLKASPVYLLSVIIYVLANTNLVSNFVGFSLFLVSILTASSSVVLANRTSLYMTPLEKGVLEEIEKELLDCKELRKEAVISVNNKEHDDLERLRIIHQANKRKNEIRNNARRDELTIRRLKIEERLQKMAKASLDRNVYQDYTSSRRR